MKSKKQDIEYDTIVSELNEIEREQEQLNYRVVSLKSMMAKYVEVERNKKSK